MQLPYEVISLILQFVEPNIVYDKFLGPYKWGRDQLDPVQYAAFKRVFSSKIVIKGLIFEDLSKSFSKIFYPQKVIKDLFVIHGLVDGYYILKNLFNYNIMHQDQVIPGEIGIVFSFDDNYTQILSLNKILEILSFDKYHKDIIPKIVIFLRYDSTPRDKMISESNKVVRQVESLGRKITKFSIQNKFTLKTTINNLHLLQPSSFENLIEVRLPNNGITDISVESHLKNLPQGLKILDLTANNITNLKRLKIPGSLEELWLGANSLHSIDGPDYASAKNLRSIDASINAISSIAGIKFPPSLKMFKITYNLLEEIEQDQIPPNIEILGLSQNNFSNLDDIELPPKLLELHLRDNKFGGFRDDFFMNCYQLTVLDLSNNRIDDLDELGQLPSSLSVLMLDNNEIDYSDLNNIFTKSLTKLSMISTGLISLSNLEFPPTIKELNLSKNEISEIFNVKFGGGELTKLDLSGNKLPKFETYLGLEMVESLNLSDNLFYTRNISLPKSLRELILNDIETDIISQVFVDTLPKSLRVLSLSNCFNRSTSLRLDLTRLNELKMLFLERNHLNLVDINYPTNLEVLSLEYNELTDIRFNEIPTNIRILKLNHNDIKELASLPYFPHIEYFGLYGDQTELMKLGSCFARA